MVFYRIASRLDWGFTFARMQLYRLAAYIRRDLRREIMINLRGESLNPLARKEEGTVVARRISSV